MRSSAATASAVPPPAEWPESCHAIGVDVGRELLGVVDEEVEGLEQVDLRVVGVERTPGEGCSKIARRMIGSNHDHPPRCEVRREKRALRTEATEAMTEEHHRELPGRDIGVARCRIRIRGRSITREHRPKCERSEVAHVVRFDRLRTGNGRVPHLGGDEVVDHHRCDADGLITSLR